MTAAHTIVLNEGSGFWCLRDPPFRREQGKPFSPAPLSTIALVYVPIDVKMGLVPKQYILKTKEICCKLALAIIRAADHLHVDDFGSFLTKISISRVLSLFLLDRRHSFCSIFVVDLICSFPASRTAFLFPFKIPKLRSISSITATFEKNFALL